MYVKYLYDRRIKVFMLNTRLNSDIFAKIKSRIESYSPTFWLPFSSWKTMLLGDREVPFLDMYRRMELELPDGEVKALDWFPADYRAMPASAPIVIFVPGVFASSKDVYSVEFCKLAYQKLGWRTCVYNRRGYSGMACRGEKMISFTAYDDMHFAINKLHEMFPQADKFLAGCSMGATNIQKYLIEYGVDTPIKAAVTISSPFNAFIVANKVRKNCLLRKGVNATQKKLFRGQLHNENVINILKRKNMSKERILGTTSNMQFDYECSTKDLGYSTLDEYYHKLSTHEGIDKINIPLLNVSSGDDILIPKEAIPLESLKNNSKIIHLEVNGGGHIEYFQGCKAEYVGFGLVVGLPHCHRVFVCCEVVVGQAKRGCRGSGAHQK
jgi:predicted alpha/beta-fold hydrolase